MDRRHFLKGSAMAAAAAAAPVSLGRARERPAPRYASAAPPVADIVDTNVDLCCWPFRTLKYGQTDALVEKLRRHGVRQAWAGSYDAMLHKNLDAVNRRLAEETGRHVGFLVPLGAVNPAWPDWEEDLRRIDEVYGMAGVKLIPGYHGYTLDNPAFVRLLQQAAERELLVQIAIEMEDERMRHPRVEIPVVDVTPLPAALREAPGARVMLVNPFRHVRGERLVRTVADTDVLFGISNLDGAGGLERILRGEHWYLRNVAIPADRLVFGSHAPFFPLEYSLLKFVESDLEADDRKAMLHANAERLLNGAS